MLSIIYAWPRNVILHQFNLKNPTIRNTYCTIRIPEVPSEKGKGEDEILKQSGILGHSGTIQEEGYFYNRQQEELRKLKERLKNEAKSPETET